MPETKRKPGRPKKSPEQRRGRRIVVRLTKAEWRLLDEEARLEGRSLSEYARRRMLPDVC
jgi:uncharacterized protein (DUF1778 family)